ncbi:MAG: four helix bundle protein [Chitinophagaceae bacterium]|nr:four helix bundle protein [Chitinophagaceae bacterium]
MTQDMIDNNPLLKHCFQLSLKIMAYTDLLEGMRKYPMARQLFKSGTAIGALSMEAQNAESRADFIHKMKIAAKEAEETQYWLMLCQQSGGYPPSDEILAQLQEIQRIVGSILKTAKKNSNPQAEHNEL